VAQHPLLVRHLISDERLEEYARLAARRQLFGGVCTYDRWGCGAAGAWLLMLAAASLL
jgi:hypothetical protein